MPKIGNDWDEYLQPEFHKPYYLNLREFLKKEYSERTIYPKAEDIFNAFKLAPFSSLRVVIIGQDPYINKGEAHGLAFSVNPGIKIPPSLRNVYKEVYDDVGAPVPQHGHLADWARQGVLLLNTTLTVRAADFNPELPKNQKGSKSHCGHGWEEFTDNVIKVIDKAVSPVVFMLWGNNAKAKSAFIASGRHKVLYAAHPSPLAGNAFSGCRHFSKANEFLESVGKGAIDWTIA
ncbi:MAG: uracil-DNA glycosylase [Clostridiales bacterium]|nr:uracil-DNA glycosylase [Clostridiales bacterium]